MKNISFSNAYFIKLGEKEWKWDEDSIKNNKARIKWSIIQIEDIIKKNWKKIKIVFEKNKKKGVATKHYNALKAFCEAITNDIFITFYKNKLFWCFLDEKTIQEDKISKYRTTRKWSCENIKGEELNINNIPGRITQTQRFSGTICPIKEKDTLKRIINGEKNPIVVDIESLKIQLKNCVQKIVKDLHWYEQEILADLIFRQAGWKRISRLGGNMKDVDMELEEPITKRLVHVQVKAKANKQVFIKYANEFTGYKLFFVVFKQDKSLENFKHEYSNVEIISNEKIAELVIELGLLNWVKEIVY